MCVVRDLAGTFADVELLSNSPQSIKELGILVMALAVNQKEINYTHQLACHRQAINIGIKYFYVKFH